MNGTCAKEPWLRYRDTGLYVLPYRHYALEFAALPFQHEIRQFDKVCLELPTWLDVDRVRNAVTEVSPGTGCILIPSGDPVRMLVPEYTGDANPTRRQVFNSVLLPITTDAMMSVLRLTAPVPNGGPQVEFVDADMPIEALSHDTTDSAFPHVDAQEVTERGLAEWYARWKPTLQSSPSNPRDACREAFMALRLIESVLIPGCKALFVCGAMHWHRIEAFLDEGAPDDLRRTLKHLMPPAETLRPQSRQRWLGERLQDLILAPPSRRFTACSLDPSILYSLHLIDIPHIVEEFERQVAAGVLRVERSEWIRQMVAACWERTGRPVSTRALAVMETFVRRRQLADARWSCDLDRHLLPCATAAAGKSFAYELGQQAMQYGLRPAGTPPEGRVVPLPQQSLLIFVDNEIHLITMPQGKDSDGRPGRPLRTRRPTTLTGKEREDALNGGLTMKPPCEELLHQHMCDTARRLGHDRLPFQRQHRPRRFRGNLGLGPDARRTIRTQACGDDTLYVRHRDHVPKPLTECDLCPVVWVFNRSKHVVDRVTDFFRDNSRGQTLLTSFFWFHERGRVDTVRVNRIAWFVRLYRNVTPSWDKAFVEKKLISLLPPEKFCTVRPWEDGDLPFDRNDPDLAVACAAKWSICDHITVVRADPSYQVGEKVRAFARARGIRVLEPDAGTFDRILLNRYQTDHEVPTEGTWHPPDPVAVRLVEPVPGFDDAPVSYPKQTGDIT